MKLGFVMLAFCGCVAALAQGPVLLGTRVSGTNLVISGSNGVSGGSYYVLASTNLALALNQWPGVALTVLPASANFTNTITNAVAPGSGQRFYALQQDTPITSADGMALIPAGTFTIGDTLDGETDAIPTNVHVSAFYMDTNLVSYSQWQSVYNWSLANGYGFDHGGSAKGNAANQPVQTVDWYDVVKWSNARSQQAGLTPVYYTDSGLTLVYTSGVVGAVYVNWTNSGYRLPTEAEWEKAARGGLSGLRFPWGDMISWSQANYYGDPGSLGGLAYDFATANTLDPAFSGGTTCTSPAGCFGANGYGLYDMAGNVFEWCWDWYAPPPYPAGSPYLGGTDLRGSASSPEHSRVLRGGIWNGWAYFARCAYRFDCYPTAVNNGFGFRCVRGL